MKLMEANINALTNEIEQPSQLVKLKAENLVSDKFVLMDVTRKVTLSGTDQM